MNSIFVVKGISGSGKSSRTLLLLKYFDRLGLTIKDFKTENESGKTSVVGKLVEELDLVFIGKAYTSGSVERWQGYDALTGFFQTAGNFSKFLQENLTTYSFVVEGAGITQTHRLRPKFLEEIGFKSIVVQYYNYPKDGREAYYNRIIYRSGEKPKKDVMWDKNIGFINDAIFSQREYPLCKIADVKIFVNEFDEPIFDLGVKMLKILDFSDAVVKYYVENFSVEFDYINKNKFENW